MSPKAVKSWRRFGLSSSCLAVEKQFVELVDFECEWVMDGEISDGDDEVIGVWNQANVIRTSMK